MLFGIIAGSVSILQKNGNVDGISRRGPHGAIRNLWMHDSPSFIRRYRRPVPSATRKPHPVGPQAVSARRKNRRGG